MNHFQPATTKNFLQTNILYIIALATLFFHTSCKNELEVDKDTTPPKIEVYSLRNNATYNTDTLKFTYKITDENFRDAYLKVNSNSPVKIKQSGTQKIPVSPGEYKISIAADDKFDNNSEVNYNVNVLEPIKDTIPPKINISSPKDSTYYTYEGDKPNLTYSIEEDNFSDAWYTLNGGDKQTLGQSGVISLNLEDGDYKLVLGAEDKSMNSSKDSVNFSIKSYKYLTNPFVQPNDSTLNWYGSGDVDGDNVSCTSSDIDLAKKIVDGSYVVDSTSENPWVYRTKDRADVSGDGKVTLEDVTMMEDRKSGARAYLPGEWNLLPTRGEREDWFMKMVKIDKTNELWGIPGVFVCTDFSFQFALNFQGDGTLGYVGTIKNPLDNHDGISLRNNGRFNIPVYPTDILPYNVEADAHMMDVVITGDSVISITNGQFHIEPQSDSAPANQWILDYPNGMDLHISGPSLSNISTIAGFKVKDGKMDFWYLGSKYHPERKEVLTRAESDEILGK